MMLKPYKGYEGVVTFVDPEANMITGEVVNIQDGANFQARTPGDLQKAFEESVDDYLAQCARDGRDPDRPFSGQVMLRMEPELHRAIHRAARLSGQSINAWAKSALSQAAAHPAVKVGEFYDPTDVAASRRPAGKRKVAAERTPSAAARKSGK